MKCIVLLAVLTFASAAKYEQSQVKEAEALFQTILDEIQAEREVDENTLAQAKRDLASAKATMDSTEASWKAAEKVMQTAQKYLTAHEGHLQVLKTEYSRAKTTRDSEEKAVQQLNDQIAALKAIGGSDKAIGALDPVPEGAMAAIQTAAESLPESSSRKQELAELALQVSRGDVAELPALTKNLDNLDGRISEEETTDKSRVTAQEAVVAFAQKNFNEKLAIERAKYATYQSAVVEHKVATDALAHTQEEFNKSEESRTKDEALVNQMKDKMVEMSKQRDHLKDETEDLQAGRESAAADRLSKLLREMWDYIQEEEDDQLAMVNLLKKQMQEASVVMIAALADYNAAKEFTAVKLKEMEEAEAALKAAQRALAIERSTAIKERRLVATLRTTIQKFQALKAQSGECPIVDGEYCAGGGNCVDDKCVCNSHHIGESCATCEYGYAMDNGVCVESTEAQTGLLQYSAKDLTTMLLSVERDVHGEQTAGVSALLTELITKLDETEKKLTATRDKRQTEYNAAVEAWNAAVKAEAEAKRIWEEKVILYEKAKAVYELMQAQYDEEHPIRLKEQALLDDMSALLVRLTGNETYRMEKFTRPPAYTPSPTEAEY